MDSQNLSESIKKAVQDDRRTQTELADAAGITQAQLSRFLAGKRGMLLSTADRLAAVLGLRIVRSV